MAPYYIGGHNNHYSRQPALASTLVNNWRRSLLEQSFAAHMPLLTATRVLLNAVTETISYHEKVQEDSVITVRVILLTATQRNRGKLTTLLCGGL